MLGKTFKAVGGREAIVVNIRTTLVFILRSRMPSQIMMSVSGKIRIEMAQDGAALVLLHNSGECQRDTPHESSDRLALAW